METTTPLCKCCGAELDGKFCSNCGQRSDTKRLTLKSLWLDFIYSIGNIDHGIVYTLKGLFTHPGSLIKEYLDGRRVIYTRPITLLIVLSTILGLLSSFLYYSKTGKIPGIDMEQTVEVKGVPEMMEFLQEKALGNPLVLSLLIIPFSAWMTKLFFRKYGARVYNYSELLVMNIFMACQRFVYDIVIVNLLLEWIIGWGNTEASSLIHFIFYIGLVSWCFKGIFTAGWVQTIWKSVLVFFIPFIAFFTALIFFYFTLNPQLKLILQIQPLENE